jgi:cyclase
MIHSVDRILGPTDGQTKIVPGHGPVATRADLQDYRDMLVEVRQSVRDLIAAGKTMDEVVAAARLRDPEIFTKMVFSSLTGTSAS